MTAPGQLDAGLYLIATPIGNLGDITERARTALAVVDVLMAEDTRHSRKLLNHLGIERTLIACHEHNESSRVDLVLETIRSGKTCGLISDAGSPGISDPGFRLVRACRKGGVPVYSIPGASAIVAALTISGLPTDAFTCFGFLPPKKSARTRHFEQHKDADLTLVYFESTHRIGKFLADADAVFGPDRTVCLARELTKQHETVLTGSLADVREQFAGTSSKGEFVVMIAKEGFKL